MRSTTVVSAVVRFLVGLSILAVVPGVAFGQGALFVVSDSVGVNTSTPEAWLHVTDTGSGSHGRIMLRLTGSTFAPLAEYEDGSTGVIWRFGMNNGGDFVINDTADPTIAEMRITPNGSVYVNSALVHPDYVLSPGYPLRPIEELASYVEEHGHLPGVLTSAEREQSGGIDLTSFPLQLLEKIEELTLYTIEQQELIRELRSANAELTRELRATNQDLEARIAALESEDRGPER